MFGGDMICFEEIPFGEELQHELSKLEIEFVFQPIYDSRSMEIYAYEALMRPKGKSPLQLIDEYQKAGKLHIIEIATCFGAPMSYRKRGYDKRLCINSFPSEVLTEEQHRLYYERYPEMQGRLIVEIVEYTDMALQKWEIKKSDIKAHNIGLSLDDFGSGNNDLGVVALLSPDIVKLDRALITGIDKDMEKQREFVSLVNFFHNEGMKVVAEGVETAEELEFIRTTEADYLQGFYFGIPK